MKMERHPTKPNAFTLHPYVDSRIWMPKIKQGMSLKKVNWEIIINDPVWAGMNARGWSNLTDDGDEQYVIGFQSAEDANSFEAEFAS